jgi:hypothetical protein
MSGVAIPEQRRSHSDTNSVTLYNGWAAKADIHTGKRDSIDVAVDPSPRLDDAAFDGGEFPEIPESIAEIRLANYKNWLIAQCEKNPDITIRLNTMATPEMMEGFDSIIAALGSEPVVPRWLPGVEHCRTAVSTYGHEDELGQKVVIIGGGQVGLETAVHLERTGRDVTLIEMLPQLAGDASKTHRDELLVVVRNHADHLHVLLNAKCTGVEPGKVSFEVDGKAQSVDCDNVLLAVGLRARRDEADAFMNSADDFYEIGDCVRARTVEWCTKEAFYAAINL